MNADDERKKVLSDFYDKAFAAGFSAGRASGMEEAAKVCEEIGDGDENWTVTVGAACAAAIRGRIK